MMNPILQFDINVSPPFQGGVEGVFLLVREAQRSSFGHPPLSTMLIIPSRSIGTGTSKRKIFPNQLEDELCI